jgi:hypothetical protein
MTDAKKRFADQLLAADPPSPDARARYEKEIRAMFEKPLSPRQRGGYLVAALVLAGMAGLLGWAAFSTLDQPEPTGFARPFVALTAVAAAGLAGLFFLGFWVGVNDSRTTRRWAAGIGVGYLGLIGWLLMLCARQMPTPLEDHARTFGLVLVVYAAVAWVRHRVSRAEWHVAERLLEIELRLADLTANPRPAEPVLPVGAADAGRGP